MPTEAERLVADAARWRDAVRGRAPSNHRVLAELAELVGDDASIARRVERAWSGRRFDVFYERPLLFVAALRFDALRSGPGHPLWRGLGSESPEPSLVTRAALAEALTSETVWTSIATRYVQTNETSRAVAWLWPAALAGCDAGGRSLALVEIGAAAGLNLVADRLPAAWTDESGARLDVARAPNVAGRVGIDRHPLDVGDDECVAWMRACIWAGETERLERFDAAVKAFRADPPEIVGGSAVDAPGVLERAANADVVLAFQTIVRDYFDPETDRAYEAGMRAWLGGRPRASAVWCELEIDHAGADAARPAALAAHLPDGSGGVLDLRLARTSYHPRDLVVDRGAVASFVANMRRARP